MAFDMSVLWRRAPDRYQRRRAIGSVLIVSRCVCLTDGIEDCPRSSTSGRVGSAPHCMWYSKMTQ